VWSAPHPISLGSILILFILLILDLPIGLFPSRFPTKKLYAFLFSVIRSALPSNPFLLVLLAPTVYINFTLQTAKPSRSSDSVKRLHPLDIKLECCVVKWTQPYFKTLSVNKNTLKNSFYVKRRRDSVFNATV
jgi:hypothetical protein